MTDFNLPKTYNFGGGDLVDIQHLMNIFDIGRRTALKYLQVLRIKPMYIGKGIYFSLPTFNRIMFVLSRPGAQGFLFPGTRAKNNSALRKKKKFLVEVTDEILEEASSPRTLAEMAAATGNDTSMVKKLISQSNAQSRKDKE